MLDRGGLYCILADLRMTALNIISIAGRMILENVAILSRSEIIIRIFAKARNLYNTIHLSYRPEQSFVGFHNC